MTVHMHDPLGTHGSPHKAPCRWSLFEDSLCPLSAWWFSACCLGLPLVLVAPHGYLWFLPLAAYPFMMTTKYYKYWVYVPRGVVRVVGRCLTH